MSDSVREKDIGSGHVQDFDDNC